MGYGARAADTNMLGRAGCKEGCLSVSEMGDGHVWVTWGRANTHTYTHVHRKGTELGAEGGAYPFRRLQHGTSME